MTAQINQHYIPKFYLNGFTNPEVPPGHSPSLLRYDIENPEPKKRAPVNVANKKYFYSFFDQESIDNTVEVTLSKIESEASSIFKRLENNDIIFDKPELRYVFGRFVSFLRFRTPQSKRYFEEIVNNREKMRFMDHLNKNGGIKAFMDTSNNEAGGNISTEEFLKSFNGMKIKPPDGSFQVLLFDAAKKMNRSFYSMKWHFLRPQDGLYFITSDAPVVFFDPANRNSSWIPGHDLKRIQIIFPVTRNLCLIATWDGEEGYSTADRESIIQINRRIAESAEKYLFSPVKYSITVS